MKRLSAALKTLMNQDVMVPFLLIKIGPDTASNQLTYTTLPYDYTHNGDIYLADHPIVGLDSARISDTLDKESFKIGLSDPNLILRGLFEGSTLGASFQGAPMVVYIGLINNSGGVLDGIAVDQPMLDVIIAYRGQIDTFTYTITPDEDIVLSIENGSPMSVLDLTRTLLTSRDYLQRKYPGNTSYDEVYEGSEAITLLWGKNL
jgi:hypothetical protein